jgi:nascent polypeptide-associated complex subunit beta
MPTGVLLLLLVPYFLCSEITEMLPGILNQLGADSLTHLKRLASGVANASSHAVNVADGNLADNDDDDDDEV